MSLESDLAAAQEVAQKNVERALALETVLFTLEVDIAEFQNGGLREIPARRGLGEGVYARLHELSKEYRGLERVREFLPLKTEVSQAAQWFEYGRRLARTGSPGHAYDFLWKAFRGTLPVHYRLFGSLVFYTGRSVFSFAGDKPLRLDVASELVPVLYRVAEKKRADRLIAQMLQLVAEGKDESLVLHAHGALSELYSRLRNERFALYHRNEAEKGGVYRLRITR